MKGKAYRKCLSVILSSSLVLSPAFAANEQLAKSDGESKKIEGFKDRISYAGKVLYDRLKKDSMKICIYAAIVAGGAYIARTINKMGDEFAEKQQQAFMTITPTQGPLAGYPVYADLRVVSAAARYAEERKENEKKAKEDEMKKKLEANRLKNEKRRARRKQVDEWQKDIRKETGIEILENFFEEAKNDCKWRHKDCRKMSKSEVKRRINDLLSIYIEIPLSSEGICKIFDKLDIVNEEERELLYKELVRIGELNKEYNYHEYRGYQNRMLLPYLSEFTGDYEKQISKINSEEKEEILSIRKGELKRGNIYMTEREKKLIEEKVDGYEEQRKVLERKKDVCKAIELLYDTEPLSEEEKEKYNALSNKYNEALSTIEGIVNDHDYRYSEGLSLIIHDIATVLDSVEDASNPKECEDVCREVENYAISTFRQRLYDESFMKEMGKIGCTSAKEKLEMDFEFKKEFSVNPDAVEKTRFNSQVAKRQLREKMIKNFNLNALREAAQSEDVGIFKKFSPEFINRYREECMKNEIGFKEYCLYANKKAEDFKADLNKLRKSDETSKESKDLDEWIKGEKALSFNDLRENAEKLSSNGQQDNKNNEVNKVNLDDLFPGANTGNEDVANVLMIADMVKNEYFTIADESKVEQAISK